MSAVHNFHNVSPTANCYLICLLYLYLYLVCLLYLYFLFVFDMSLYLYLICFFVCVFDMSFEFVCLATNRNPNLNRLISTGVLTIKVRHRGIRGNLIMAHGGPFGVYQCVISLN